MEPRARKGLQNRHSPSPTSAWARSQSPGLVRHTFAFLSLQRAFMLLIFPINLYWNFFLSYVSCCSSALGMNIHSTKFYSLLMGNKHNHNSHSRRATTTSGAGCFLHRAHHYSRQSSGRFRAFNAFDSLKFHAFISLVFLHLHESVNLRLWVQPHAAHPNGCENKGMERCKCAWDLTEPRIKLSRGNKTIFIPLDSIKLGKLTLMRFYEH